MTQTEALKLALEALEEPIEHIAKHRRLEAITAIQEALVQPEQESVVESFMVHMYNFGYKAGHHDTVEGQYIDLDRRDMGTYHSDIVAEWVEDVGYHTTPLQRTWVGLTDAEIKDILDCGRGGLVDIKKTEAKLKEKNT